MILSTSSFDDHSMMSWKTADAENRAAAEAAGAAGSPLCCQ
jgi:hypothetical protein